jgi:hypothetical protein
MRLSDATVKEESRPFWVGRWPQHRRRLRIMREVYGRPCDECGASRFSAARRMARESAGNLEGVRGGFGSQTYCNMPCLV